jgi:signal transduction histidine kinase
MTTGRSSGSRRRQRLGIALFAPVVLLVPYLQLRGAVRAPWVVWPTVALVLLVSLPSLRPLWRGSLPRPARSADRTWLVVGTLVGLCGLVPLLTVGLHLEDVAVFAVVVAVLLVVEVQAFAGWQRWSLVGVTITLWASLLVLGGVTGSAVLLLHAAGALVLVVGTARIADELAEATANVARERRHAEQRATVLAEVLRARSLDPAEVHRAVLRGMDAVGFDVMAVRRVDSFAGRAVLVDHRTHLPLEMEIVSRVDLGLLGVAIRERREVIVEDVTADPRAIDRGEGFRGALAVPLVDRGEVFATVEGAVRSGPVDGLQVEAVRQLAAAAEGALVRARSFAEDRRLVRELDRLQSRTEAFVDASADGLTAPMHALRADVRLLRLRTGELDGEQRAAAVRRIDDHGRRLASLIRSMVDDAAAAHSNLDLDPQPVGLRTLVTTVTARAPGHGVVVEVAPELVVAVDRALAERLVEELVAAVAAYGPDPSVRITARRVGDRIRLAVSGSAVPSRDPAVRSADRGVVGAIAATAGYASGWMPTVAPASADAEPDGVLSLMIAEQIARAHGSELSVRRPPGGPATIGCSLPVGW